MTSDISRDQIERSAQSRAAQASDETGYEWGESSVSGDGAQYSESLLSHPDIGGRGNGSVRAATMQKAQQTHGNHAVQRMVQRSADTSVSSDEVAIQRFTEPTPWMNSSPFVEPTPWAGHGGRHSDWNGLPSGPNLGIEPANPGAGWAQAPHTPTPQIDNPAFPGGGPFFNPTPSLGGGGGWGQSPEPQIDNPVFPGGGPFFNPTPELPGFGGGGGGGGYDPAFGGGGGGPFFNPTPNIPLPGIEMPTLPMHPMPGGGMGAGWEPSGPNEAPGPWAYYKQNKYGGYEDGFGAFHGEGDIGGGIMATDDILYGHGKAGTWDDGQGGTRSGIGGDLGVANMTINQGGFVTGQAEALTASAEASWGDSGATLGAQATAVGGSVTLGGDPTNKSSEDESVRLGLSEGIGLAGRLHWGDKDKDGHREYGLGADFGPFSFDLKSEDPIRTLANAAAGPMMANMFLGGGNATAPVEEAVGNTWNAAKQGASDTWDETKKFAGNAYDQASSTIGSAYDAVSDYLPW